MKTLTITINGLQLEVEQTPAYVSFSVSDFDSFFTVIANKTNVLKVPATPLNNTILGRLQELNTTDLQAYTAVVRSDGVEFTGKVRVTPAEYDGKRWWYGLQVVGGNGDWVKELENEQLNTTDMSYLHHTYNAASVVGSHSGLKDYVYDLADRGQEQKAGEFMLIDRYPAIRLRAILEAIFAEKGIKLISNYLYSEYFNKKFLLFTQDNNQLANEDYKLENIYRQPIFTQTHTQTVGSNSMAVITPFYGASFNFLSSAVYTITEEQAVNHRFETQVRFRYYRPNTNVIFVCGSGVAGCGSNVTIGIYKGATLLSSSTYNYSNAAWNSFITTTVQTTFVQMAAGDNVTVQISVDGYFKNLTASPISVNFEVEQVTGNYLRNYTSPWFAEGATVTMDKVLPKDMSKLDFVKWLAGKYDLMFNYNTEERKLYCENRINFYESDSVEWSNLIDLDGAISIEHTIQPENDVLEIAYSQDSADRSQYRIRKQEVYRTTVGNALTESGIERIELEDSDTIFARQSRFGLTQTYIPTLWSEPTKKSEDWIINGLLVYPEQSFMFNLRVLDYEGLVVLPSGDSYKFENTTYVTYPKFEREAIADLVGSMWDYKIRLKKQAKRITCSMLLSDSQINRIRACVDGADLRTPVIVRLAGIADSLFTIESIEDFNLLIKEPTQVRLVEAFFNTTLITGTPSYLTDLGGGDKSLNSDTSYSIFKGEGSQQIEVI